MKKVLTVLAIVGLVSAAAVRGTTAGVLDDQPPVRLGSFAGTPHQMAVTRGASGPMTRELATPAEQNAAVPPEKRVSQTLFGDFPATLHQASLGLRTNSYSANSKE